MHSVMKEETMADAAIYPAPTPYPGEKSTVAPRLDRRRPGREQGQALEKLGHAVEYLIDSRMFLTQVPYTNAEEEAVQILMGLNRRVFESCPEILPMRRRVTDGLYRIFHGNPVSDRIA